MFLVGIISWWYGSGWKGRLTLFRDRIASTASFFSIGQLFATLFSPFRQISANAGGESFADTVRGFFDNLISRVIGAFVRFFTILAGILIILVQSVYQVIILLFWLILPALPVVGFIMFAVGWVPTWM